MQELLSLLPPGHLVLFITQGVWETFNFHPAYTKTFEFS